MKLSEKAERYYAQACGQKMTEIDRWFQPEIKRVEEFSPRGGGRGQSIATLIIERWRRIVQARMEGLLEAYEQDKKILEEDDVEEFFGKLDSAKPQIIASFMSRAGGPASLGLTFKIEQINREAEQKLSFEVTKSELKATLGGGMYPDKVYTKENTYESEIMRHGTKVEVQNAPETNPAHWHKTKALRVGEGVFKFVMQDQIEIGANIKIEDGRDIWRVVDIMDEMSRFSGKVGHKVFVQRVGRDGNLIDHTTDARMAFYGPTAVGVMQTGGTGNTATGTATVNIELKQDLDRVNEVFQDSDEIDEADKEEASEALDKIATLAGREQSRTVLERIRRLAGTVADIATRGNQLVTVAGPLIQKIHEHFPNIQW